MEMVLPTSRLVASENFSAPASVSCRDTTSVSYTHLLFQEQGLPFLTKEVLPAGGLFRIAAGFAPCGMDIYVRASDAQRAQALLDGIHFRALPGEEQEM